MRWATDRSTSSPAAWPIESLITLKLSRSNEQDGDLVVLTGRRTEVRREDVHHPRPVVQPRQRVVHRLMLQLLVRGVLRRHVAQGSDGAALMRVPQQVDPHGHPPGLAGGRHEPERLDGVGRDTAGGHELALPTAQPLAVLRVDQLHPGLPDDVLDGVAEHLRDGRRTPTDPRRASPEPGATSRQFGTSLVSRSMHGGVQRQRLHHQHRTLVDGNSRSYRAPVSSSVVSPIASIVVSRTAVLGTPTAAGAWWLRRRKDGPMPQVRRFDHGGITVADLDVVTAFFVALGLEVEGRAFVEGGFLDTVCGIPDSRTEIVMLRPADGGTCLELSSFVRPDSVPGSPAAMAIGRAKGQMPP
jgi:hypothetical protein